MKKAKNQKLIFNGHLQVSSHVWRHLGMTVALGPKRPLRVDSGQKASMLQRYGYTDRPSQAAVGEYTCAKRV